MKSELKKFISYFFVGGVSAIVEWTFFAIFNILLNYVLSTIIAFMFSTTFNYFLGKYFTFKDYKQSKKDIISVFIVSGMGLLFNVLFMYIFIDVIHLPYEIISKILSTGLVFIWNYISRRLFIYNNKKINVN